MESYEKIKKVLALGFMNFLDENKSKDKMCLSNGECEDIEKAFNEQDWSKLARYLDKYILSTLSEKPMNQDGLEKEIQRFLSNATKMDKGEWKGKYPISEMGFGVVVRHFAKWGAERQKEHMLKEAVPFYEIFKAVPPGPERENVRIIIVKED